jgi:predicted membrane channel-forming protein YqfA (hemolysin III family)
LIHWPDPIPDIFGAHEIMHLFVMAGSLAHFWFMLEFVVPYERSTELLEPTAEPSPAA